MNILFTGYKNPSFMAVTDYIEIALKEMGHQVSFFDHRSYVVPGRIRDRLSIMEQWDKARINKNLRNLALDLRPDLFLVCGGYNLEPETIQAVRRFGAVAAAWFADYPYLFETYLDLAPYYDYFFTSGTDALERHRAAGNVRGHWLPFACLPALHRKVSLNENEKKVYTSDVVFIGTAYPERIELLNRLMGFKLAIWGPAWNDRLPREHPLRRFVRGGALPTEAWIRAVAGGKVVLNYMGSGGSTIGPQKTWMANSRVFELLGCGAFQLVDNKEDVLRLFKSGQELVCFETPEQAPRIVEHYLKHEGEREAIARRGREKAVHAHTYPHRLAELIRICGKE